MSTPTVCDDALSRPRPRFLTHAYHARVPKLSRPDCAPRFPRASALTPKVVRVLLRSDHGSRRPDHMHAKVTGRRDSGDVAHMLPMLPTRRYPLSEAMLRQIFPSPSPLRRCASH
jgi:hypothetical protein